MNHKNQPVNKFFKVIGHGQSYLNLIYLLAAFPLGLFYFVFLVSGISLGISLAIIWIGIPILLVIGIMWWLLAGFERSLANHLLNENIPAMAQPTRVGTDRWSRIKSYFVNPVTWKSLLFLFLKFPLGMATFVILITLISLTLAFLTMPFTYQFLDNFQVGLFINPDQPFWQIDSLADAFIAATIGLMLWPLTLHLTNGLAVVHAKFARLMLGVDSMNVLGSI